MESREAFLLTVLGACARGEKDCRELAQLAINTSDEGEKALADYSRQQANVCDAAEEFHEQGGDETRAKLTREIEHLQRLRGGRKRPSNAVHREPAGRRHARRGS